VTNGGTGRCSHCHMNVKPGSSYTTFNHGPYTDTSAEDCAGCHSWPGTDPARPNWKGAAAAHASSGATNSSTLDCNTCHGQNGSANVRLTVAASAHYGGVSNGNRCVTCHINFAGFKGTVSNLRYAHSNAAANSGNGCRNCHVFKNQLYTTLTNTPPLNNPTTGGGHSFSQGTTVRATFYNRTYQGNHTDSRFTRCAACHVHTTTNSNTNVWVWVHEASGDGSGCDWCHSGGGGDD
jgi:hypothetical protein